MGVKLRSIARNPRSLLAYKGVAFSILLWAHTIVPGWLSGVLFVAGAGFLYANPLFNASSFFPFFIVEIIISFAWPPAVPEFRAALIVLLGIAFAVTVGLKNLVLTHREQWARGICYALSYLVALIFFLRQGGGPFWLIWLITVFALGLAWSVMISDRRIVGAALVLFGELIWVVSWLPIGFFASANTVFLTMLFIGDALVEKKIALKHAAVFFILIAIVLGSSYWKL